MLFSAASNVLQFAMLFPLAVGGAINYKVVAGSSPKGRNKGRATMFQRLPCLFLFLGIFFCPEKENRPRSETLAGKGEPIKKGEIKKGSNMPKIPQEKNSPQAHQWWYVENLIAGLDATPTEKYLLTRVHLHINRKSGRAWASQKTLAVEASTDLRTVERFFAKMKRLGAVQVHRIRTGKSPSDQYNEYWLDVERLCELQRPAKHPSLVRGASGATEPKTESDHPTPMSGDTHEHPTPMSPNTRQIAQEHPTNHARTPDTHVGEVFEVKQLESKAKKIESSSSSAAASKPDRSDAAPKPKSDDDDSALLNHSPENLKIENLYRNHPNFVEVCSHLVLTRAKEMGKTVASPERYVRAALPSLLREKDLLLDISFFLPNWNYAERLYRDAMQTFQQPVVPVHEHKREPTIGDHEYHWSKEVVQLRLVSKSRGLSSEHLRAYLWKTFRKTAAWKLTFDEFRAALAHFESLPVQSENVAAMVTTRLN